VDWLAGLEQLGRVASTNDVIRERGRAGAPEGTAVLAESQNAGRGREGRSWRSPAGNLFLSVLLRPVLPPDALPVLPLLAGVALAEAAAGYGVAARLKWPNDVLVGERKLAGILVEATSSGSGVEFVVVGVGMNLVLDPLELPEELRSRATSIRAETGRSIEPLAAARAVLARLGVWYDRLSREGRVPVLAAWRLAALPWWGERVEVRSAGARIEGVARDIDQSGALLLDTADGATLRVLSGDARELRRLSG